ncbi:MAG: hypothetical protein M1834_000228 [Cirrosporium novae-zelandiae]|nr:MAG: hypothetical protein M1834_000228 [Cirrosporium novae-zelandiae]
MSKRAFVPLAPIFQAPDLRRIPIELGDLSASKVEAFLQDLKNQDIIYAITSSSVLEQLSLDARNDQINSIFSIKHEEDLLKDIVKVRATDKVHIYWYLEIRRGTSKQIRNLVQKKVKEMSGVQLTLMSSDGETITVDRAVAEKSVLIKNLLEDIPGTSEDIPIPNVTGSVLKKVIEWCEHHKADPPAPNDDDSDSRKKTTDIEEWDSKFMAVDQEMLFEIILAANYLDIKALLDTGCKVVANMIKGKTPEEIRKTFNIQNDFTPEEEDQIRRENEWAEEYVLPTSSILSVKAYGSTLEDISLFSFAMVFGSFSNADMPYELYDKDMEYYNKQLP